MWGCLPASEVWVSPGRSTGVATSLYFPASVFPSILLISRVCLPVPLKKSHNLLVSYHQSKRPLPCDFWNHRIKRCLHCSTQITWGQVSIPEAAHMSLKNGARCPHEAIHSTLSTHYVKGTILVSWSLHASKEDRQRFGDLINSQHQRKGMEMVNRVKRSLGPFWRRQLLAEVWSS